MEVTVAVIHAIFMMVLFSCLAVEFFILKGGLLPEKINALSKADLIYGITAAVMLITGLVRVFVVGKGIEFYLATHWFHAKMTLFILIALLSIYPTTVILRWRFGQRDVAEGEVPSIDDSVVARLRKIILIEMHLVLALPVFAVLMSRAV